MTVHSHLNQPLDATIVLDHLDASERASLDVGIAPSSMFQRFGIRRSSAVDRIHIDTRTRDGGGQAVVHVTTERPVGEPFVDFLLQVESGNGKALREYTAMLDPAGAGASTAVTPSTPVGPQGARTPHSGTAAPTGSSIYRVRPGDTLWSIAAGHTSGDTTVAQTMLAIYRANPSAFGDSMRALSQNARLHIPSAADIRSIDAGAAQARLQKTKAVGATADAAEDDHALDRQEKLAASGEAPPAGLRQNGAETGATSATSAAEDQTPVASGKFGRLSLPSDAPWPEPVAANSGPSGTGTTNADAGAPASNESPDGSGPGAPSDASVESPRDVTEADSSGWLSPRNLLLLVVLLVLIVLAVRRLRERGYQPVVLDRPENEDPEWSEHAETAATPTDAPVSGKDEPAGAPPVVRETAPAPAPREDENNDHEAGSRPPETASHAPFAETDTDTGAGNGESGSAPRPGEREAVMPPPDDRPLRFRPVTPDEPGGGLFAHRRPATNEEIEGLAFETQPLPDAGQRQHDLGAADEPGLEFEAGSPAESGTDAEHANVENADSGGRPNDPYALEMIDPGEFDLYDPPSRNSGSSENDPNQSVAIRLDLARMYLDMGDSKAAHELLVDVRKRGDEEQRRTAERLLEQVDA